MQCLRTNRPSPLEQNITNVYYLRFAWMKSMHQVETRMLTRIGRNQSCWQELACFVPFSNYSLIIWWSMSKMVLIWCIHVTWMHYAFVYVWVFILGVFCFRLVFWSCYVTTHLSSALLISYTSFMCTSSFLLLLCLPFHYLDYTHSCYYFSREITNTMLNITWILVLDLVSSSGFMSS